MNSLVLAVAVLVLLLSEAVGFNMMMKPAIVKGVSRVTLPPARSYQRYH